MFTCNFHAIVCACILWVEAVHYGLRLDGIPLIKIGGPEVFAVGKNGTILHYDPTSGVQK